MLKLNLIKPRDALSKQLSKKSIVKNDLEQFKSSLNKLMGVNAVEGEEHQKNDIKEFLASSFGYKINTKGRIDYCLYDGLDVKVIIEAKSLVNKAEMITPNEANRKAMHEALLYFMQERKSGNDKICRIVIANAFDWFVFDAVDFERLFWQNKSFKNRFLDFDNGKLLRKDTPYFYDEIAKPFLDSMKKDLVNDEEIECIYLDLRGEKNEKELNAVYKLLSPDHLLKEFNPNDANSLNKAFYNEFLYILGLEESKESGKKLIQRAKTPQNGTLYENIRQKLEHQDKHNDFETIVSVLIVWINRILFLKLLESQIYRFNGNDKSYKFLNSKKIGDFDALESLFFEILAKPVKNRNTKEFDYVPYLNSSLFEYHELEKKYISISNLRDSLSIKYYAQTVLKEGSAKKSGDIDTLAYLFEFLDAYNFASDGAEEVIEDNKTLINASVLGLIFEKLNGYKDGSFYTPSFITMYMAKEAIQKAVFGKFELAHGIKADTIEALNAELIRHKISIGETKKLIDSVTLCDPAVGSGHFLVSALSELIYIKYSLGLFGFRHLSIDIESDELFVRVDGEFHEYKKPKDMETDNHKLQKMLFEEKRLIIENQLFGVDINPNSVNITRLRLWIELLKHTYYHADGALETLPNIDINIKCGNSLISRFDLSDSLKIKNIKHEIEHYKKVVGDYKENLGSKKEVLKSIENLKDKFKLSLKAEQKTVQTRNAKLKEFVSDYGYDELSDTLVIIAVKNNYKQSGTLFGDIDEKKRAKILRELTELQAKCDEIESG
ncbi:MAG TPA: class I SAM-dependent DNA methyltransferase, partial [Campylobacterales bacterium]|nr:class I SAM-dependent DNA methyltransferase [Campylobacterales bacterium]